MNDPDSMLTAQMVLAHVGQPWRCDERTVEAAMREGWRLDVSDIDSTDAALRGLLQTGSVYVLDLDQMDDVLRSQPPELPVLPPLPFKRVLIEGRRDSSKYADSARVLDVREVVEDWDAGEVTKLFGDGPITDKQPLMIFNEQGLIDSETGEREFGIVSVWLIGLIEHGQGNDWDVYIVFSSSTMADYLACAAFVLTPDGVTRSSMADGARQYGVGVDQTHESIARLALNCAHLITARGVPRDEIRIPRPTRRRWEKRWRTSMPKAYFVNIAAAAEIDHPGSGDREYHVRWMVQGHWRHIDGGKEMCTCLQHRDNPQAATWIAPYVKGPAGAPWKGRPIHVAGAA